MSQQISKSHGLQIVKKGIFDKYYFELFYRFPTIFITTTHKFSIDNCMLNNDQQNNCNEELETVQIEGTGLELPTPENGEYHFES